MNIHELLKVFLNESNNKELMLHACMLTGNREDALDLLSDLLIEIYENPMVQKALDPMAYYKAILRNKAYNLRRRNKRMIPVSPDELPETTQKLSTEVERHLEDKRVRHDWQTRLLKLYSPELTDEFIRCYADGYSIKELAEELGVSENTLSQRFCRMRKKLKIEFANYMEMMLCLLIRF